jgi:spermidine/putrescine transport system permease protein
VTAIATGLPVMAARRRQRVDTTKLAFYLYSFGIYLFLYIPIAILVLFSFNMAEQTATWEGFTLHWYQVLLQDDAVWSAGWMSLKVAMLTTLASTVFGTAAALGLRSAPASIRTSSNTLLLLPIVLPEIIMAVALLRVFSAASIELDFWTIWFAHVVFCVSYVVVVVRARLAGMDDTLEEAAADLGATPWVTFWTVTLPQLAPAVVSGALLVLTLSLDDYVVTSFVSGVGNTTLPLQIYAMFRKHVTPEINAICTLLLVTTTLLILAMAALQRAASTSGKR